MKKLVYLIAPFMCAFSLSSCGGGPTKHYNVTFMNEDTQFGDIQEVEVGKTATKPADTPEKNPTETIAYKFAFWASDKDGVNEFSFDTPIYEDITLYASYTLETRHYTVTWKYGDTEIKESNYLYQENPKYKGLTPTIPDDDSKYYIFNGVWKDKDGDPLTEDYKITDDVTFTAQFDSYELGITLIKINLTDVGPTEDFNMKLSIEPVEYYTVDWGDGRTGGGAMHHYNAIGQYTIQITNATSIGINLDCKPLLQYLHIGNSITTIKSNDFSSCENLTDVTFSNGVKTLYGNAFQQCKKLEQIYIPCSVTYIESTICPHCPNLKKFEVDPNNSHYDSRNDCNAIIETETDKLIQGCNNTIIPQSIKILEDGSFSGLANLKSINIPKSLTTIGDAFNGAKGMESIIVDKDNPVYDSREDCNAIIITGTGRLILGCNNSKIPEGVTSIYNYAFCETTELKELHIPSTLTSIDSICFRGSIGIEKIDIHPDNPKYDSRDDCNAIIETETKTLIYGCKTTIIPNTITSISFDAFYGCSGLTEIEIPASVTSIGSVAFDGCTSLTSFKVNSENKIYDSRDNCNALITKVNTKDSYGQTVPKNTLLMGFSSSTIPSDVEMIYEDAFYECLGLKSLTISSSVKTIGYGAFYCCTSLTYLEIPESVTTVEGRAFELWTDSQTIKVPFKYGEKPSGWANDWNSYSNAQIIYAE